MRLAVMAVIVALSTSCKVMPKEQGGAKAVKTTSPPHKPPSIKDDSWDWVQLTSEEWLKGEIKWMRDYSLMFDSDELDDLKLTWRKIKVLKSPKSMSILRDEGGELVEGNGPLHIEGDKVVQGQGPEYTVFDRGDLISIVPGGKGTFSFWSGGLDFGMTLRTGNTDQVETTLGFNARRRSPKHRISFDYMGNFGKVNGEENVNNQRFTGSWDISTSRRWFVTPIALELYRDPFQNIALRATPVFGAGYHILLKGVDKKGADWDFSVLAGYRSTSFESGAADTDTTATAGISTDVEWDVNEKLELTFMYDIQVGLSDPQDTNQNLTFKLSYDAFSDFDLDFSIVWNFVGQPRPDADGVIPKKADTRFIFVIGWDF